MQEAIHSHWPVTPKMAIPQEFISASNHVDEARYQKLLEDAQTNPEVFWADRAKECVAWFEPWTKVTNHNNGHFRWFEGATLNAAYNCLDRHIPTKAEKIALIWEGESGEVRRFTFQELLQEVSNFCHYLDQFTTPTDVVTLYMPLTPEAIIAMLACARMGLMHNVVFGGFSSEALAGRILDSGSQIVITADSTTRGGKTIPLKSVVQEALTQAPQVRHVIEFNHTNRMPPQKGTIFPAKALAAEHPLFLLYTSGSTGKPKGLMHTTGGYMVGATYTSQIVFDLQEQDVFWCTADIGWITGHSYVLYGALSNGVTSVIYEGAPSTPHWGRFWEIIERHKVTKFYTAPTAIRAMIKNGPELAAKYDLSSLKLLGSVGEPISPETWLWYFHTIGKGKCPIVDTWWQTETGSILIAPVPSVTPTKPGSATRPLPGIFAEILDDNAKPVDPGKGGYLVIRHPWPSMARTIFGDHVRYLKTYWQKFPGYYLTGDGARQDEDGYFWVLGRVDDVINVSGHRLSTMEIESALVSHPAVAEAAVVGVPDDLTGEAIACFVVLKNHSSHSLELETHLKHHVVITIGALARPKSLVFKNQLPKTRSGKIMRRILRDFAAGREPLGDMSTMETNDVK